MTACRGAPSIRTCSPHDRRSRAHVCVHVPAVQGIESKLWSAASSQSENDTVTELEGKREWGYYYWMGAICYATCHSAHIHTRGYFMLDVDMHFYRETSPLPQHSALSACQMWLKNMKNFPQLSPKNHGNGAVKLISRRYFNISLYERRLKFPQQQFHRPVLVLDEQETVALSRCSSGDVCHVCTETRGRTAFGFCKIICQHCNNSQC